LIFAIANYNWRGVSGARQATWGKKTSEENKKYKKLRTKRQNLWQSSIQDSNADMNLCI